MKELGRFESKIYYSLDGCWYWTGAICKNGYGRFLWRGVCTLSTRVSYRVYKGPIPEGLCVLHTCDNPSCVNPDHLFLGDQALNMRDMMNKGRRSYHAENNPRTKLSKEDVVLIRSGRFGNNELAKKFNMSYSGIRNIIRRRCWTTV